MDVKKIFITLIIVVACVAIGALVLNVLLPNVATALVDAIENMIYQATKLSFDFNGNGKSGNNGTSYNAVTSDGGSTGNNQGVGVTGFQ
jgi:hypothetical protein